MYMEQSELARLYDDGMTIRQIAVETGESVHRVRKALLAEGVTFRGARGKKPTKEAIVEHYRGTQSCAETAKALGVHADTVNKYAKAEGILRAPGGIRRYAYDAEFFDTYTPLACYWAGFLAADGALVLAKGARRIQVNLTSGDRCHLEAFKRCAGFGHPISDVVFGGYP